MICKQFLITGIIWASLVLDVGAFPIAAWVILIQHFPFLKISLVSGQREERSQAEFYYALVTMHGTVLVFFVLTGGLSGTFANFLIPLQLGARDMASPFLNMLSYWFFFMASV
jgi:cytochrome c oxidase subunit 1